MLTFPPSYSRLPHWIQSLIPRIFYVTEKAWNYYPRTVTEYTCFLLPRFCINIQTCYLDDAGTSHNVSVDANTETAGQGRPLLEEQQTEGLMGSTGTEAG